MGDEYNGNIVNVPTKPSTRIRAVYGFSAGYLLPPAKVTRFIDAKPVDVQLNVPVLGQLRVYNFMHNVYHARPFLHTISSSHTSNASFVGCTTAAVNASHIVRRPAAAVSETALSDR